MMKFPRRRRRPAHPDQGDGPRLWLWRLAADAVRTVMAVGRFLLWLWREGNEAGGR